jgi:hypothetical protein
MKGMRINGWKLYQKKMKFNKLFLGLVNVYYYKYQIYHLYERYLQLYT